MIHDFEDFCTWMYVIVDDIWQQISPLFRRPGPPPVCGDSELITMALVGECRGWDVETELLSHLKEHRDLFPHIPSQSRLNRRRRNLASAFNLIRLCILRCLDLAQDQQCLIDSLPIPVVQFHLVPGSTGDWRAQPGHSATISAWSTLTCSSSGSGASGTMSGRTLPTCPAGPRTQSACSRAKQPGAA